MLPEHGGSGDAEKDFDTLTGGTGKPASPDTGLPEGSLVGENGIIFRPGKGKKGPGIEIPANGSKPHEGLHYPKGGDTK